MDLGEESGHLKEMGALSTQEFLLDVYQCKKCPMKPVTVKWL